MLYTNTSVTPAVNTVLAKFAKEGDFNDYLREATPQELRAQANRIEAELVSVGSIRSQITDLLSERLGQLKHVISAC